MEYIERVIGNDVTRYVTLQGIHRGWVRCLNTSTPSVTSMLCIFITFGVIAWTWCDQSCGHYPKGPQQREIV